jgi:hypothetical protein
LAAQCGDDLHQLLDCLAHLAADALILAPLRNGGESDHDQPQAVGYIRVIHFAPGKCRPATMKKGHHALMKLHAAALVALVPAFAAGGTMGEAVVTRSTIACHTPFDAIALRGGDLHDCFRLRDALARRQSVCVTKTRRHPPLRFLTIRYSLFAHSLGSLRLFTGGADRAANRYNLRGR